MSSAPIKYVGSLFNSNSQITDAIEVAREEAMQYGLTLIKAKTPVDTGLLKASWQAVLVPGGIEWYNKTPYAAFQELGTKYIRGRHMLSDSLPAIEQRFVTVLAQEIGKKLAGKIASNYSGSIDYTNIVGTSPQVRSGSGFVPKLRNKFKEILSK